MSHNLSIILFVNKSAKRFALAVRRPGSPIFARITRNMEELGYEKVDYAAALEPEQAISHKHALITLYTKHGYTRVEAAAVPSRPLLEFAEA